MSEEHGLTDRRTLPDPPRRPGPAEAATQAQPPDVAEPAAQAQPPDVAEPASSAGRRLGLWILGAGAIGALALPVWRVGIGWPIAALAVVAVIAVARAGAQQGHPVGSAGTAGEPTWMHGGWRGAAGVAALTLVALAGVRAAGWLSTLCLLTAVALTSYSLTGGETWRGVARGLTALPGAALEGLGLAAGGAGQARARRTDGAWSPWRATLGFGVGVVLLLVFGGLFSAADPAFADLLRDWTEEISATRVLRAVLGFVLVATAALGAAHIVRTGPASAATRLVPNGERRRLGLAEWIIPLAMLDALFAIFVWVQLRTLFGGRAYVLSAGGPDYAVHARGGFGQLVFVTVLTLGVVTVLALWAGRATPRERVLLRVLGGALCALTLVIVASALKRLGLYAGAYGFTVERLLGYAGEVWLGLVFVLLLGAGVRLRAGWLPRATVAAAVGVLLGLAAINPEALMARTLLSRLSTPFPVDYGYVSTLSADAIDELDALPEPHRTCALSRLAEELRQPDPWYAINLSRERARDLLTARPLLDGVCGHYESHGRKYVTGQPPMADIGRDG